MKLFKTPWFYVGIMFLILTFTTTFNRWLEYVDSTFFSQIFNYKNDAKSSFISLIPWLILPLIVTYFISRYVIKCVVGKRLY